MPKLVRDHIPELMRSAGEQPQVIVLHDDGQYLQALRAKLLEEMREYRRVWSIEELADVIEVVDALKKHVNKMTGGELNRVRALKRYEKGGFAARQYLTSF